MRVGLFVYDCLTFWKNIGIGAASPLPKPSSVSKSQLSELIPKDISINTEAAVQFYDCQIHNCDRMTYSVARSAEALGAQTYNYHQVKNIEVKGGKVSSIEVEDLETGQSFSVEGQVFINAAGPWVDEVLSLGRERLRENVFSKGVQTFIKKKLLDRGLAIESSYSDNSAVVSRGGRSYFLVPWRNGTLVGTSDEVVSEHPDDFKIKKEAIHDLLKDIGLQHLEHLSNGNFGGLRPVDFDLLGRSSSGDAVVAKKDSVESYPEIDNLFSIIGVKYTTFRALARRVLKTCRGVLGEAASRKSTSKTLVYGTDFSSLKSLMDELSPSSPFPLQTTERLCRDYGSHARAILEIATKKGREASFSSNDRRLTAAEICFCCESEQVKHLDDIVFRRCPIFVRGINPTGELEFVADIAAEVLGWDSSRKTAEIEKTKAELNRFAG